MSCRFASLRPLSEGFPGRYAVVSLLSLFCATRFSWLALKFVLSLFATTPSCIIVLNLIHSSGVVYAGYKFHLIDYLSIKWFATMVRSSGIG